MTDEDLKRQKNREYQRNWYAKHCAKPASEKLTEEQRKARRRYTNKRARESRMADPDYRAKVSEQKRQWRQDNPEKVSLHHKKTSSRPESKKKRNERIKIRRETDIQFAMSRRLRSRLSCIKSGFVKDKATQNLLGCTMLFFIHHIEKQFSPRMTWENKAAWHLDHVRPLASFDLTCPKQQREAFHWSNLQPLWAKDNLSKGAKW